MAFKDFKKYIFDEREKKKGLKHTFYSLTSKEIEVADMELRIPIELKNFYTIVGYGYMYDTNDSPAAA